MRHLQERANNKRRGNCKGGAREKQELYAFVKILLKLFCPLLIWFSSEQRQKRRK